MLYQLLGKSGLPVPELCLRIMTFGENWRLGASREESRKQFDFFLEVGEDFIDTSVNYTDGTLDSVSAIGLGFSHDFLGEPAYLW